jgi:hypothetical protein
MSLAIDIQLAAIGIDLIVLALAELEPKLLLSLRGSPRTLRAAGRSLT